MKTIFSLAVVLLAVELGSVSAEPWSARSQEQPAREAAEEGSGDSGYLSLGVSSLLESLAIGSPQGMFGLLGALFFGSAVASRLRTMRPNRQ